MIGNSSFLFKWVTRALVYSALGFVLFVFARNRSERALTEHLWECEVATPERSSSYLDSGDWRKQCAIRTVQCIKDRSGFFTALFLSETKAMSFLAPVTPCKYIGKWRSIRPDGEYDVELARDGHFSAEPAPGYSGRTAQGRWSVVGTSIQWVYDQPFEPRRPDTNPIVDEQGGEFVLIEESGARTLFRLMQRGNAHCED